MQTRQRNPYARKHPWLIALGILTGVTVLLLALVIVWFVLSIRSLSF